jgi:hypothetical protein
VRQASSLCPQAWRLYQIYVMNSMVAWRFALISGYALIFLNFLSTAVAITAAYDQFLGGWFC